MKRSIAMAVAGYALLSGSPAIAADIIETAKNSTSIRTFLAAVKAAGISEKLQNSGPYTIFAPSDSAFEKLPPGTVNALMKDKAKLNELVAYHVIPGKVTVSEVKPGKVQTMQGNSLTLTNDNGKVTVDEANVIQSDLVADNGIIHEIDAVVQPKK